MKNKYFITFLGFLIFNLSFAQDKKYFELIKEAESFYKSREYKKSKDKYTAAFNLSDGRAFPKDRYNSARSFSLAGDIDTSFYHLMKLANGTYKNYEYIIADSDLKPLHNDNRWNELLLLIKSNKNKSGIIFYVDKNVTNAKEKDENEIIELYKKYLESDVFRQKENPYWDFEGMNVPDDFTASLGVHNLNDRIPPVQCKVIGVFPVKHKYYALKSVFSHIDENNEIQIDNIITVYAKKIKNKFKLSSSTQYHRKIWNKKSIGSITYYIHPEHKFSQIEADRMKTFNDSIALKFEMKPLKFDYFTTNHSRDVVQVLGYDYMPRMYRPEQTGGLADTNNNIIYAGNNSEYYPHESVHLYVNAKNSKYKHFLINEGIAALFGGSSGHSLGWHLRKLKEFLLKNPDYNFNSLDELKKDIPNGEYMTDLRYVIGGLVCKNIYEKEGMKGLYEAMDSGRTDKDFYRLIYEKFGVDKQDFEDYIKSEVRKIPFKN